LRGLDFAQEARTALLAPTLEAAAAWRASGWRRWLREPLLRLGCLVLSLLLWLTLAVCMRIVYTFSVEPQFRFLPPGCAVETESGPDPPAKVPAGAEV